jgi:8-oxo-dGTP diphosphatase
MADDARRTPTQAFPTDDAGDEARFLAAYDQDAYPRPSVAVDVALLTVAEGALHAALVRRERHPQRGRSALPGGFIRPGESPEAAVGRVLEAKAGLMDVFTAQLATFGTPDRDPRGWVVAIAYYALVPADRLRAALAAVDGLVLARVEVPEGAADTAPAAAIGPEGELPLAFDHGMILGRAVARVRGRLWYAPIAFELMPDEFTLLDLQVTYEALLGRRIDKNSFRRRILASGLVAPVGRRREGMRARPAELFRFDRRAADG